jgi:hypothetical protein
MQHSCTREDLVSSVEMKEKFGSEYPAYAPDRIASEKLKSLLTGKQTTIVLGKWCSDSQLQVPRFYKVLDGAGVSESDITLICVDEMKKAADGAIDGLDIVHVPTFIFSANNKEIGRITESPMATLEDDMVTILENR